MSHTHRRDGQGRRRGGPDQARGRPRGVWGAALALACAAALTACGPDGGDADAAGTASEAPSSPAATPTGSGTPAEPTGTPPTGAAPSAEDPGGSSAPTTPKPGGIARCETDGLALSLVVNGQEMNSKYFDLRLTNTGSEPCDLLGHPGVSLLDAGGKRVGEPATRSQDGTGDGGPVRLRPGQAAHATVKTAGEGVTDGRCWPEAATLLVYPPGSKQTVTTGDLAGLKVCGDSFQVGPVGDRAP
ncbi:DUF4232 domain-containing protein [Streptomyces albidoflavus]